MIICINSGSKGGTGKTTFAELTTYVWRRLEVSTVLTKPPVVVKRGVVNVVDFPAFSLTDLLYVKSLGRCDSYIYVVDESFETLKAIETIHVIYRKKVLGVIINKVIKKPSGLFLEQYKKFGNTYIIRFDDRLAIHKAIGAPPYRVRSVAVLDMTKAAVDILLKEINPLLR